MRTPAFWYHPPTLLARLVQPLGWVYDGLSRTHRAWRSRNPYRAPVPVISIGNIVAGGSGKTPLTALLAQHFAATHTVAIIVGSAAADEAAQLARQCPHAQVICHRNKRMGVRHAVTAGATLILLDDSFHRTDIARDVDVLTFGPHGIGNGLLLPAGPLREPTAAATRATCYVLQDCPLPAGLPPKPTFHFTRTLDAATLQSLRGKPLVAVAAIAHPETFFNHLRTAGLNVVATLPLPDHTTITPTHCTHLQALIHQHAATLVCTEKDSPKLPLPHTAVPLWLNGDVDALVAFIKPLIRP